MKIMETLKPSQVIDVYNGKATGIFPYLILEGDELYNHIDALSTGYYLSHSPNKKVSRIYRNAISVVDSIPEITKSAEEVVASIIRAKFIDKWIRVYEALIAEYNPLDQISITEVKNGSNSEETTYGNVLTKSGSDTDTITHNVTTTDDGKTGTKETTSVTDNTDNSVYGFNSTQAVNSDSSEGTSTTTFEGKADENTTYNQRTKTGTESTEHARNTTDSKTGTDVTEFGIDESVTTNGRKESAPMLIQETIDMRAKNILYDIIYTDIDSIIAISIY